jgi:hypothetical protein
MRYPHTIEELLEVIYEDNEEHFASTEEDCDCAIHTTVITIVQYWGE